ncbi:MAG TPA: hypothetical protein VHL53_00530 [Acidimicrobiia bacterium]|nr:hypothetical protein [Acidimicrobiia bacterium]
MRSRPRLDREPLELPPLAGALEAVWDGICALADALGDLPWTVVGGQMVFLHAAEAGVDMHRVSTDIDAAVDVRAAPDGMKVITTVLTGLGFEPSGPSPEGHAYRFVRTTTAGVAALDVMLDNEDADDLGGPVLQVDVLAPEGLGPHTDLRTVGVGVAFPAAGVSQALTRTELVPVRSGGVLHWVPRPSLLGAIVGKAAGAAADTADPERHLLDLAFLCGLVTDPFALAEQVTRKDRSRLKQAAAKLAGDHPAWRTSRNPTDAQSTLDILIGG